MEAVERIIVALDTDVSEARKLAQKLAGKAAWLKVGMTLFYAQGPQIVEEFKALGFKIFVDLKLHDIPHQVRGAARAVAASGADMLTVHAAGGSEMMQAACEGAEEGYALYLEQQGTQDKDTVAQRPICLAITVLTSLDAATLASIGVEAAAPQQVARLAQLAEDAGMDGIVCSPQEAALVRSQAKEGFILVTPGVRPAGSSKGDQARVATPAEALKAGADYLVIGRPITAAEDPLMSVSNIESELTE